MKKTKEQIKQEQIQANLEMLAQNKGLKKQQMLSDKSSKPETH